jgi:hypothetical protein
LRRALRTARSLGMSGHTLILEGNPMTHIKDHAFSEDGSFQTGVIYFARGHSTGCRF